MGCLASKPQVRARSGGAVQKSAARGPRNNAPPDGQGRATTARAGRAAERSASGGEDAQLPRGGGPPLRRARCRAGATTSVRAAAAAAAGASSGGERQGEAPSTAPFGSHQWQWRRRGCAAPAVAPGGARRRGPLKAAAAGPGRAARRAGARRAPRRLRAGAHGHHPAAAAHADGGVPRAAGAAARDARDVGRAGRQRQAARL